MRGLMDDNCVWDSLTILPTCSMNTETAVSMHLWSVFFAVCVQSLIKPVYIKHTPLGSIWMFFLFCFFFLWTKKLYRRSGNFRVKNFRVKNFRVKFSFDPRNFLNGWLLQYGRPLREFLAFSLLPGIRRARNRSLWSSIGHLPCRVWTCAQVYLVIIAA